MSHFGFCTEWSSDFDNNVWTLKHYLSQSIIVQGGLY
jgi:hypothetical protein